MSQPPFLKLDVPILVVVRPLDVIGGVRIDRRNRIIIYLNSKHSAAEAANTAWHEIVHVLRGIGKPEIPMTDEEREAEETQVIDYAAKLTVACPDILEWLGVAKQFS